MTKQRTLPLVIVLLLLGALVFAPSVGAQEGLPQPVAVGSNTAGEVSLEVPSLRYVLVGNGGDSVVIQVLGLTPGFAPRFSVSNAASEVVLDVANPTGEANVSGEVLLAATGAYIIEVSGEQGNGGQFVLALQAGVPPPEPVVLVLGEPVTATAGGDSPLLIFRFNGAGLAGQTLAILSDLPDSGPAYRIIDEATGADVLSSDGSLAGGTFKLGAANTAYTIEIRPGSGGGETPFTICLGCAAATAKVETTAEATAEPPVEPTAAPTATVEVCNVVSAIAGAINARSGPGTAYSMVGAIRAGEAFPALAQTEDGAWLMFDLRGRDAWVSSAVARLEGGCATLPVAGANGAVAITRTPVASAAGNCTIVSTYNGNANVRIGPNEGFNILGSFTRGQTAPALARTSDSAWFMFSRNGVDAWVSSAVARLDGDCARLASVAPVGAPAGNAAAAPPAGNGQPNVPPAASATLASGQPAAQPTATQASGQQPAAQPNAAPANGQPVVPPPPAQPPGVARNLPDLIVNGVLGINNNLSPAVMRWDGEAINQGDAATGPWQLRLCAGNTCQQFDMPSLPPGEASIPMELTYPSGLGVLTHTVIADSANSVAESNESNNTFSATIGPDDARIIAAHGERPPAPDAPPGVTQGQPDLAIVAALFIDDLVSPEVMRWDGGAVNHGDAPTGPWRLRLCAGDTCEEFEMPSLAPGAASETRALRYPTGTGVLSHTAFADSTNIVAESDEANNILINNLGPDSATRMSAGRQDPPPAPPVPLPDLELITNLYFKADTNEMVWEAGAWNAGDTPTGQWKLTLCVQTCAEYTMSSLQPGAAEVLRMTYPAGLGVIPHMAMAESNENVTESDTGNNYFEGNLGPDNASPI